MKVKDIPKLHIYPQRFEHCEAVIVGNREGLRILRDTISAALDNISQAQHESDSVFVDDGEGYTIVVERKDVSPCDDIGGSFGLPYSESRDSYYKVEQELMMMKHEARKQVK